MSQDSLLSADGRDGVRFGITVRVRVMRAEEAFGQCRVVNRKIIDVRGPDVTLKAQGATSKSPERAQYPGDSRGGIILTCNLDANFSPAHADEK